MNFFEKRPNEEIMQATNAIAKRHETVVLDTSRPQYHFVSPAKMLIDVWGGIYHEGYYHLFYDINHIVEEERQGGSFGHLRSRDLVTWENLPLALIPEYHNGENQLNDGTVVIDPKGEPLMYYTRCFEGTEKDREHVAVRGSKDLIQWERLNEGVPVLTMENHGGPRFHRSWSDPIIFQESGRTFMIISKCVIPNKGGMIPIYEATDDSWLKWEYRGVFAEHTGEVLNFIKVKDKWVLIYSPYDNPKYFVGTFDVSTCKFTCEKEGILSYGYVSQGCVTNVSRGFYATSSFYGEDKTPYIIGWISGFFDPKGWDGCVSLCRMLDIDESGDLRMRPIPQLKMLRKDKIVLNEKNMADCGRTFEIDADLELREDCVITIEMQGSFRLELEKGRICFNDIEFAYNSSGNIKIRLYVDVTVAEIFVDDGKASVSRCFPEIRENAVLHVEGVNSGNKFEIHKL